jgi:7,8-dihydropterin-6-yl-methyl-4-(beta-D-ribofuranosyl)aminobenzene 5'-phosphate synthase
LRLTVLIENEANEGLASEHGLAAGVEFDGFKVLFDAGQSNAFIANAGSLNFRLTDVKGVVLSHGHYDHIGGLSGLYSLCSPPIYAVEGISREALVAVPRETINVIKEPTEIVAGVIATGPIPRKITFEPPPRTVPEDQALLIEKNNTTALLVGCAHAGAINTLEFAAEITGSRSFDLVFGGFHLWTATPKVIENTAEALHGFDIRTLALGHCTGKQAIEFFKRELAVNTVGCPAGTVFEL